MAPTAATGTWLVTGGAGYIGAHVVEQLLGDSQQVVVLDDLSTGVRHRVPADVPFVVGSVSDRTAIEAALRSAAAPVTGIVHFAALKKVDESIRDPLAYWEVNVNGLRTLLEVAQTAGIGAFVFSSSAAVYGEPALGPTDLIDEQTPCVPINPYGATKLAGEWMLEHQAHAQGMTAVSLRYFNVVGAGRPALGDVHGDNLVPRVFRALKDDRAPVVFGDDYPTPDGTCVRDYIHVSDLARAHVAAAHHAASAAAGTHVPVNLGTGSGYSVLEVIAAVGRVAGREIRPEIGYRREGDPAVVVASPDRARTLLGWQADHNLLDMVGSSWQAAQAYRTPIARSLDVSRREAS